jgi:signal transduction histidine kinase
MNLAKLIGCESQFALEHRILNTFLLSGIALSVPGVILSFFVNSELTVRIAITTAVLIAVLYYLSIVKKYYSIVVSLLIFCFNFVCFPAIWLVSGGLSGGTPYFMLLYAAMIAILLRGLKRIAALVCLIVMIIFLTLFDYYNPSSIIVYNTVAAKYAGIIFCVLSATIVNAFLFVSILNQYMKETEKANKYLAQIQKQQMELAFHTEMARLDRLNIIGEMAASIGHEIRNPLTTVRGFLQLFQKRAIFTQYAIDLNLMIDELDRACSIITELLSLTKNKVIHRQPNNLDPIIEELYPLMQASAFRQNKEVLLNLQSRTTVLVDKNEIKQCILNLTQNALEAMPAGGKVTISTFEDDSSLVLSVKDTGPGIPPEIYEKLGTPFLTTKDQGTGLGLPVCYRIAERHWAKLEVETGPTGTEFIFKIPLRI